MFRLAKVFRPNAHVRGYLSRKDMLAKLQNGSVKSQQEWLDLKQDREKKEASQPKSLARIFKDSKAADITKQNVVEKRDVPVFTDPYLLSDKIHQLASKSTDRLDYAFDILRKNRQIANVEVYGTLISLMLKNRQHFLALKVYKDVHSQPNPCHLIY